MRWSGWNGRSVAGSGLPPSPSRHVKPSRSRASPHAESDLHGSSCFPRGSFSLSEALVWDCGTKIFTHPHRIPLYDPVDLGQRCARTSLSVCQRVWVCVWVRERVIKHVLLNVPTRCNADLSEGSMEKRK